MRLGVLFVVGGLLLAVACSKKGKQDAEDDTLLNKIPLHTAVIKVGDREVSGAALRNWCVSYATLLARQGPLMPNELSLIRAAMDIHTKLLLIGREAERRGVQVTDQELEDRLSKEMKGFESTEAWLKQLEASGSSRDERKQMLRWELLSEKYEKELVEPELLAGKASEANALKFYTQFPELFQAPLTVKALHILRTVAKDAPESERQKERQEIEKALARVKAGEKFEDVAREVSTDVSAAKGGDIGTLTDQVPLPPQLKEPLFKLKSGENSAILESPIGYSIFKATEVKPARKLTFDEVKEDVRQRLLKEAKKQAMERTAADLRAQAMAKNEIQWIDWKTEFGEELFRKAEESLKNPAPEAAATGSPAPAAPGS